jgi:small ligand-binding sensory domain FIST
MPAPHFSAALSTLPDLLGARTAATDALLRGLDGRRPDLLLAFVTHHYGSGIDGLGPALAQETGARVVLGCTTEAAIGSGREAEGEPGLVLFAGYMPGTELRPFRLDVDRDDEGEWILSGEPVVIDPQRAGLLLFGDPHAFPAEAALQRFNEDFPRTPISGGMASGGHGPGQDHLFDARGPGDHAALGVVIEGDVALRTLVSQGCRPVGRPFVITRVEDNMILELGGKPAMEALLATMQALDVNERSLFGNAPFVGLAVDATKSQFERGDLLARGLLGVDPKRGGIAVGDMPRRGMTIQFLARDADSASEDLEALLGGLAARGAPAERGALLFTCTGRGLRLFGRRNHDVSELQKSLSSSVPVAGFFANGEFGPVGHSNCMHGYTASIALLEARND